MAAGLWNKFVVANYSWALQLISFPTLRFYDPSMAGGLRRPVKHSIRSVCFWFEMLCNWIIAQSRMKSSLILNEKVRSPKQIVPESEMNISGRRNKELRSFEWRDPELRSLQIKNISDAFILRSLPGRMPSSILRTLYILRRLFAFRRLALRMLYICRRLYTIRRLCILRRLYIVRTLCISRRRYTLRTLYILQRLYTLQRLCTLFCVWGVLLGEL